MSDRFDEMARQHVLQYAGMAPFVDIAFANGVIVKVAAALRQVAEETKQRCAEVARNFDPKGQGIGWDDNGYFPEGPVCNGITDAIEALDLSEVSNG